MDEVVIPAPEENRAKRRDRKRRTRMVTHPGIRKQAEALAARAWIRQSAR